MAQDYDVVSKLYATLPPYSTTLSPVFLPYIAFILLLSTFTLGFYFTTLPKDSLPVRELSVASLASILAGFGVVSLFCAAGVNV